MRTRLPIAGTRARSYDSHEVGPKPDWLKVRFRQGPNYLELRKLMREHGLHTVCEESGPCPNISECWEQGTATFLIGGNVCTRRCTFCDIITGKPPSYDREEPQRVAQAVAAVGLKYAVVTGVARDDLPDGGAWLWAETIRQIRSNAPGCGVEVLTPDFRGDPDALRAIAEARPDVFAHNLETVRRLHRAVRPSFTYERSLQTLRLAASLGLRTKSGIMLGLGEDPHEAREAVSDIRGAGAELLTVGQYLAPSRTHPPVVRYVTPSEFTDLGEYARSLGFAHVESGPLVRSSYHAREQSASGGPAEEAPAAG